jgi:hypothetical protein
MLKENMDLCFCFSGLNHNGKMNIDVFYVPTKNYKCYLEYYDAVSLQELIPILHKMIIQKKKFKFNFYV